MIAGDLPTHVSDKVRRNLDHLVLPVGALATARQRLAALGFTVAPDALHPFGTANACVFLADKTYLEPLAVAQPEDYKVAALQGNAFVALDHAYRFRRGDDGFSALVFSTEDAEADHDRFRRSGFSGGDILEFSRPMKRPDGEDAIGTFRLAFARDLRAPNMFCFTCQRVQPLPADRSALETHANGVTGIRQVILSEPHPTDFQSLLQEVADGRETEAHMFGMDIHAANAHITVLNDAGLRDFLGVEAPLQERGLQARAIVFTVASIVAAEALLTTNDIRYRKRDGRLLVPPVPGQGAIFVFGE